MTRKRTGRENLQRKLNSDDSCNAFINCRKEADRHPQNPWIKVADKKPPVLNEIPGRESYKKAVMCAVHSYYDGWIVAYAAPDYVDETDGSTHMVYEDESCKVRSLSWFDENGDYIEDVSKEDYYLILPELPEGGRE